jgi:hypothetical protein
MPNAMPAAAPAKSVFLSKTLWVQILALAALLSPEVRGWVSDNPVDFAAAWAGLNILLRFLTSGKLSLAGGQAEKDDDQGRGGSVLPLLVFMGLLAGVGGLLPACSVGEYPISGSITFRDDASGAKAGITFYPPPRRVTAQK